jgi:hypothetical protein
VRLDRSVSELHRERGVLVTIVSERREAPMRSVATAAVMSLLVAASAQSIAGDQPLTLRVTPQVTPAPGYVRVSARILPDDDNRSLEITATSDEFSRASAVQLDGARAPRTTVFDYPNLPAGTYEVAAVLVGTRGRRAAERTLVRVFSVDERR